MNTSRIPDFANKSLEGMAIWFTEMSLRGLLFHPEDAPGDIFTITTNERIFDGIMAEMFVAFGDGVCETAYPIFMKCMGWRQAA